MGLIGKVRAGCLAVIYCVLGAITRCLQRFSLDAPLFAAGLLTGLAACTMPAVFGEAFGAVPQAASAQWQAVEEKAGQRLDRLKTSDIGLIDSTGEYEYAINGEGNAVILSYRKEEGTVQIPSSLDGHAVTVIDSHAFYFNEGKRSITSIQIPDSVTEIGEKAFSGTGVKEITIPDSVLKIGEFAFEDCRDLERVFLSKSVEKISGNVFQLSAKLAEIEVDSHNIAFTSVDGVLYNKDKTELLAVPEGKDLADFQFPDSVKVIGRSAFAYCKTLTRAVIGKNVESIGPKAFLECIRLSEVVLDDNLKVIGPCAFEDCGRLEKINIPDGTMEIGEWAFCHCKGLTNIVVPESVSFIGNKAIGYSSFSSREPYHNICITGYEGTAAYNYANKCNIAFQDAETGEMAWYGLLELFQLRITQVQAGKKKIKMEYEEAEGAAYQIGVRKAGASVWKEYGRKKTSAVIKGLQSGKKYEVRVRARREIGGKDYYGVWSEVKSVTVR